jgi:hypothetical protein
MRLTKKIGQRGLLYTSCYFLCYIFYALTYVLPIPATAEHRHIWFPIAFCAKLFTPLQGFFNVFIFLTPRYQELSEPGKSLAFFRKASQSLRLFTSSKNSGSSNHGADGNNRNISSSGPFKFSFSSSVDNNNHGVSESFRTTTQPSQHTIMMPSVEEAATPSSGHLNASQEQCIASSHELPLGMVESLGSSSTSRGMAIDWDGSVRSFGQTAITTTGDSSKT